jgi:hypothetical protein
MYVMKSNVSGLLCSSVNFLGSNYMIHLVKDEAITKTFSFTFTFKVDHFGKYIRI